MGAGGRRAGILCHLTSLPTRGKGDLHLVHSAKEFINFLKDTGISVWQMLPITPPDTSNSPYSSPSAFAGWKNLLPLPSTNHIDNDSLSNWRRNNAFWVEDWALYTALKYHFDGAPWTKWPAEIRRRIPSALEQWKTTLSEEISAEIRSQYWFDQQWASIKTYAQSTDVKLFGDIPIFVSHDSADVWAHQHLFQLNQRGRPKVVSGVPPDYFSITGQRWGTPLYDWQAHDKEDYEWWKQRMARMFNLFDILRIDHFRAIESAWAIPSQHKTARKGEWQKGPKDAFLRAITMGNEGRIIAEDLGIIPKSVTLLRKKFNLAGMAVLHFGIDNQSASNPNAPNSIKLDQVVYTGTHDNDTTVGWWNYSSLKRKKKVPKLATSGETISQTLMRVALESPARLAIIPLQDVMELDSSARMNRPGTTKGNWSWKFNWDEITESQKTWLKNAVEGSGRTD